MHKENIPFRIIVSSINTSLHRLAVYLQRIITAAIPKAKSHVENSYDLVNILSDVSMINNEILVSLDVTSLFTNVPLELVIDSINRRWEYIEKETNISKKDFIDIIKFVTSSTYFTFNNVKYKQIYGAPMGSPLSPIIADLVMQDLETTVLNTLNIEARYYFRYVNDVLIIIPEDKVNKVLHSFNSYHDRLKFMIEIEDNHRINFLDISIIVINNVIHIDWFRKKTFSERTLSYLSNHPMCHKKGVIYNLVDRAILLSNPIFHKKNLEFVINMLIDNGYPLDLIFNEINYRLKYLIMNKLNDNTLTRTHISNLTNGEDNHKFIAIPYIEGLSELIASSIKKSNIKIGYRCLRRLNGYIKPQKDKNELSNNSNVIYKINCRDCNATYIGQTKRKLGTRLKEHKNNIKLDSTRLSVISEHISNLSHSFDWDNAKILDYESNYYKRLISEMLHIKEHINSINLKKDIESLESCYFDVLDKLRVT